MTHPPERFRDDGRRLEDFADPILVVCPRCAGCATSRPADQGASSYMRAHGPRRLICATCGHIGEAKRSSHVGTESAVDDHFALPLWLRARVRGETLWAYNEEHLAWLEAFVGAHHRERQRTLERAWTMATRLPRWIKARENRSDILAKLAEMRTSLP